MIERRSAAAHVFVRDIMHPVLDDADAHHLMRVLRLRSGETVTASDGRGAWRTCIMTKDRVLEPSSDEIEFENPPTRPITVAFGVTKADKPETVVQKLTEIGVDHIAPVLLDHSVVRWDDDKIDRQHERFERVAREAAMQSRQVFLPTVHRIAANLSMLMDDPLIAGQLGSIAAAEPGGESVVDDLTAIVVGPEGGFSSSELGCFDRRVALPGGVLRAETAAIAAAVLLAHVRTRS
jgi:16S rRNA (uracil1498-N3)-methyltransferase